jgi:hypothetical protein
MNKILIEQDREGSYGIGPGGDDTWPDFALYPEVMEFVCDVSNTLLKIAI